MSSSLIDHAIAPLAAPLRHQADTLLTLRECALRRTLPGRCVSCYFRLATSARPEADLAPLRSWLESEIEIVAKDASAQVLETLPLRLEGDDLETCCRQTMDAMRDDRVHPTALLALSFRFKHSAAA